MNAKDKLIRKARLMFHALIYSGSVVRREWQDEDGQWLCLVGPLKGRRFDVVIDNRAYNLMWNPVYWDAQRPNVRRYVKFMFLKYCPGHFVTTCSFRDVNDYWRSMTFLCQTLPKGHRYHGCLYIRGVTAGE